MFLLTFGRYLFHILKHMWLHSFLCCKVCTWNKGKNFGRNPSCNEPFIYQKLNFCCFTQVIHMNPSFFFFLIFSLNLENDDYNKFWFTHWMLLSNGNLCCNMIHCLVFVLQNHRLGSKISKFSINKRWKNLNAYMPWLLTRNSRKIMSKRQKISSQNETPQESIMFWNKLQNESKLCTNLIHFVHYSLGSCFVGVGGRVNKFENPLEWQKKKKKESSIWKIEKKKNHLNYSYFVLCM